MECYAIYDGDEEEGPVRAAFRDGDVARIVYGEEDVGCAGEIGEGVFQRKRVRCSHEHECH